MKVLWILFVVLVSCDQIANGYRILGMLPLQGPSHWAMMEPLMKGLAQRGHQVDVISHFPQKKPIPNYTDISLAGSLYAVRNNISAKDASLFTGSSMKQMIGMIGSDICELLAHPAVQNVIKNPPQDPPYDIVIQEV